MLFVHTTGQAPRLQRTKGSLQKKTRREVASSSSSSSFAGGMENCVGRPAADTTLLGVDITVLPSVCERNPICECHEPGHYRHAGECVRPAPRKPHTQLLNRASSASGVCEERLWLTGNPRRWVLAVVAQGYSLQGCPRNTNSSAYLYARCSKQGTHRILTTVFGRLPCDLCCTALFDETCWFCLLGMTGCHRSMDCKRGSPGV